MTAAAAGHHAQCRPRIGQRGHWPVTCGARLLVSRVGQNRIYTQFMTIYLVIFLPKHRNYIIHIYGSAKIP